MAQLILEIPDGIAGEVIDLLAAYYGCPPEEPYVCEHLSQVVIGLCQAQAGQAAAQAAETETKERMEKEWSTIRKR